MSESKKPLRLESQCIHAGQQCGPVGHHGCVTEQQGLGKRETHASVFGGPSAKFSAREIFAGLGENFRARFPQRAVITTCDPWCTSFRDVVR